MHQQENDNRHRRRPASEVINNQFGKLPPQAVDLEEAVLGAVLLEKEAMANIRSILVPECFYKDAHQKIFQACLDLFLKYEPIDILTITNHLRDKGELDMVGGPFFITQLTMRVASAANIEFHARIIVQKYLSREIIRTFSEGIRKSFEDTEDSISALNEAQTNIDKLFQLIHRSGTRAWDQMVSETYDQIHKAIKSDNHLFGFATGFAELDKITSGRSGGDLIIIAARPGMGKTTRMLQEVKNVSFTDRRPVGVFSLEMPYRQLIIKMLANDMNFNSNLLRSGRLDGGRMTDLAEAAERLKQAPIYMNDISGLNIAELNSIARVWKNKHGIEALYVDYLQLVDGTIPGQRMIREQEVSNVSRGLKRIAKQLNIPVIALSQLSRQVESRTGTGKRPQLSDLRESGSIEQEADTVELLFRPDYYGEEYDEEGRDVRGMMEVNIPKNRNAGLGRVLLRFHKEVSRLEDADWAKPTEKRQPYATPIPVQDFSSKRMEPNYSAGESIDDEPPF